MGGKLRVLSINVPFETAGVVQEDTLATEKAFFDFDVVAVRPHTFNLAEGNYETYQSLKRIMGAKNSELTRLFAQGGVLVIFLDIPDSYTVRTGGYSMGERYEVNNYEFLDDRFVRCLQIGSGTQVRYYDSAEPFVSVLRTSSVSWTTYIAATPDYPLNNLKFFASAGARAMIGGKMPWDEGHLIILPNVTQLDEKQFFEACSEYRYKRQGTQPPDWVDRVTLPGATALELEIHKFDQQISELQAGQKDVQRKLEDLSAYRKLIYEKGKAQLEPIVLRALDDLEFGTSPSEVIAAIHEIDGRTTKGSSSGIVEVKGSKNQIAQNEFSSFVTKIVADADVKGAYSKGIFVGNGLCEIEPGKRLGEAVFSQHVLDGAKRNSVALVNSVELYWLCCALLRGDQVDKTNVREAILTINGYVDLKPFGGASPF